MKTLYYLTVVSLSILNIALSQHQIPFESKDNFIQLAVRNSSTVAASGMKVQLGDTPGWLHFASATQTIAQLKAKGDTTSVFSFSVDKLAPINKTQTLTFTITSSTGEAWIKQLDITVNPPDHFELFQNFPNPFNPSTTISYQLPNDTRVILKIYNSIGQEVKTLVNVIGLRATIRKYGTRQTSRGECISINWRSTIKRAKRNSTGRKC